MNYPSADPDKSATEPSVRAKAAALFGVKCFSSLSRVVHYLF